MLPVESWLYSTRVHNSPERGQPKERNTSTTTAHCWQITQNVAFELLFGNETFGVIFKQCDVDVEACIKREKDPKFNQSSRA